MRGRGTEYPADIRITSPNRFHRARYGEIDDRKRVERHHHRHTRQRKQEGRKVEADQLLQIPARLQRHDPAERGDIGRDHERHEQQHVEQRRARHAIKRAKHAERYSHHSRGHHDAATEQDRVAGHADQGTIIQRGDKGRKRPGERALAELRENALHDDRSKGYGNDEKQSRNRQPCSRGRSANAFCRHGSLLHVLPQHSSSHRIW
ncbi:hypothetical protein D3C73_518580 [compost metagenome]